MSIVNKKDWIDYIVDYITTGSIVVIVVFLIASAINSLRVVINGVLVLGVVVYEGINYIYGKWRSTKNKG